MDGKAWKNQEIIKQITISRTLATRLSLGNIFFSSNSITQNRQSIAEKFEYALYVNPALVPSMSWRDTTPPSPPTGVTVNSRRISWSSGNGDVRSWTLYEQEGNDWKLKKILPANTRFADMSSGKYALCAVDRMANESTGVVVSVS